MMPDPKNSASSAATPIYEQVRRVCEERLGQLVSGKAIVDAVVERYGTNRTSVIPSDYCYNRWNRLHKDEYRAYFVYVGAGEYHCLGERAAYDGLIYWRPKGASEDIAVGERVNGVATMYWKIISEAEQSEATNAHSNEQLSSDVLEAVDAPNPVADRHEFRPSVLPLSREQIERLYEEYMRLYDLEVKAFGCKPTELRHLVGRIGELYCARQTGGSLVRQVNQHGFDVVGGDGRRISVKATAQRSGFVRINERTKDLADDLMVVRLSDDSWEIIFHDTMATAVDKARKFDGWVELDFKDSRRQKGGA